MEHPIITLTTDWGQQDFFAGMVKGRLLSSIPGAQIVDISHNIEKYNNRCAAFVVKQACLHFPPGTIHIIDVCSVETADEAFVVVQYEGQYYICTDNGLPGMVFEGGFQAAHRIDMYQDGDFYNFVAYNLFCAVAAAIAADTPLSQIGPELTELKRPTQIHFIEHPDYISAHIAYIDSYGNAYLDITYEEFEQLRGGRRFTLALRNAPDEQVHEIQHSYYDKRRPGYSGNLVLTVSATGMLQIAALQDSAESLFGLHFQECVDIRFHKA